MLRLLSAWLSAILLLSALLGLAAGAWRGIGSSLEIAAGAAASLRAERALRSLAATTLPPWWARFRPSFGRDSLLLPWQEGVEDATARLSWGPDGLRLRDGEGLLSAASGLERFALAPLADRAGRTVGLAASWQAGGRTWACRALFSSFALPSPEAAR